MAINLYDFHDIIRETYNEYVSRYEIDLVDFKNEYGADSEPKFIEYQRVYLGKMRDYIIENLSKIDNEDLDSQFYHDKLQEALSDNKKMFHFLNVRLNPMNYIQDQKENTSSNYLFGYFNDLNNGLVSKLDMINYLKSYNSIEEFEAIIEGIEEFDKNYYAENLVYNLNKRDLSESFTTFKELVLSKIDELKSKDASNKNELTKYKFTMAEAALFQIFEFTPYDKHEIISETKAKKIAEDFGFNSPSSGQKFQDHYNKLVFPHNRTNLDGFPNKKSLTTRISYYNNVIEKLSGENKIPAEKELEILNNLYQHHKFN